MDTKSTLFIITLLIAGGIFANNVKRLIGYLRYGKPDNRTDKLFARIKQTLLVGFAQTKILRDKVAGPIHAGIFWGFLILLFSAAEAVLEGINPALSFNVLGPLYSIITVLTDFFCLLIIVGTALSLWRRYILKIKRLQVEHEKVEAGMILLTIFSIVTSLLLQNSARVAMGTDFSWALRPISTIIASILPLGHISFEIFWWMHIILIFCFTNYLPFSKHLHVLTSIPNVFLSNLGPVNSLEKIDFEKEDAVKFGITDIEDFSWKTYVDSYTCTHCGRCTSVCPANQTGKVLDPRMVIVGIHDRIMDKAPLLDKISDYKKNASRQDVRKAADGLLTGKKSDEFDSDESAFYIIVK